MTCLCSIRSSVFVFDAIFLFQNSSTIVSKQSNKEKVDWESVKTELMAEKNHDIFTTRLKHLGRVFRRTHEIIHLPIIQSYKLNFINLTSTSI